MSDSTTTEVKLPVLKLGTAEFPTTFVEVDKKKRVEDPANPKKKKSEVYKKQVLLPDLSSLASVLALITALTSAAEAAEPGNGLILAKSFVFERLEDAYDVGLNEETGDFDEKAWTNMLVSPERPRSAGSSIKMLETELADYTMELVPMVPLANSPDGWQKLVDSKGAQIYDTQVAFLLRLNEICNKLKAINQQIAARHEAATAKKSAAAAKAEAAAKAAAAPAQS